MNKKNLVFFFLAISVLNANATQSNSSFCKSIRDLPLNNIQKTKKEVNEIHTIRTSDYSQDNGRSVEDIEKTINPYKLSADLKTEFQNKAMDDDHDYDVYRTPDASIFNFSTTEGSLQCPVDIWALNKGGTLELVIFSLILETHAMSSGSMDYIKGSLF